MIRVDGLRFSYPPPLPGGDPVRALDGTSFEIKEGASLAVAGPNSCGKTTLCLALAGLAPRLTGGEINGEVIVGGKDVQAEPPGSLADLIGLTLQDPTGQLFNPTVEEEVAWGLENLGLPVEEMRGRIEWALAAVGLADVPREQVPDTLSGGQQKRLALAAALALKPRVLILDEPAGGLTPIGRREMVEAIRQLREQEKLTLVIAESDPEVIAALADALLVLDGGRVMDFGKPEEVFGRLDNESIRHIPIPAAVRFSRMVRGAGGVSLSGLTVEAICQQFQGYTLNRWQERGGIPNSTVRSEPAIEFVGATFRYAVDGPTVLDDIYLRVPCGQFVALIGDNGAGKSTLARHLIGILRPSKGQVRIMGEPIQGRSIGQIARQVGFAFQNPELQIFNPTVREEIAFGPRNLGVDGEALEALINAVIARFDLAKVADHPPAVLSFSARRMVAMASVDALRTPILVLDEPTVGLDAMGQRQVMDWLRRRHGEGGTIVLITHDVELAGQAERVIVLDGGQIVADGSPYEVFSEYEKLAGAGLEAPFAAQLARLLDAPALAADLTPEGAARVWVEKQA